VSGLLLLRFVQLAAGMLFCLAIDLLLKEVIQRSSQADDSCQLSDFSP
jgi:hypothetical protein